MKKAIVLDGDTGTPEDTAWHLSPRGRSITTSLRRWAPTRLPL